MKQEEKRCSACKHAMVYGWHAVKIKCDVDGHEMYGYNGKDEYRENAKNCPNFDVLDFLKHNSVTGEEIEWVL